MHTVKRKQVDNLLLTCFPYAFQKQTFMAQLFQLHKTKFFQDSDIWTVVAESSSQGNIVVGFGQIKKDPKGDYKIVNLCRHPTISKKGLGKEILNYLEWIAKNKLQQGIVYLNANAHKLAQYYQSNGYRLNGKPYLRDGKFELYKYCS